MAFLLTINSYKPPEYDIDGATLKYINNIERISMIIPKFKQQILFLEEREKLFNTHSLPREFIDSSMTTTTTTPKRCLTNTIDDSSSSVTTESSSKNLLSDQYADGTNVDASLAILRDNGAGVDASRRVRCDNGVGVDASRRVQGDNGVGVDVVFSDRHDGNTRVDTSLSGQRDRDSINTDAPFPDQYHIPPLPTSLIQDIENGNLHRFGPHFSNRQILIDAISFDLIHTYKLFYPTHKQFDLIGSAIVQFLRLPVTKDNIGVWKDAIQTKLKRKRSEHMDNDVVKDYRLKYARTGAGRPVKRRVDETALRDKHKQLIMIHVTNDKPDDLQAKINQLKDFSQIDLESQLKLWRETFSFRREFVRNHTTSDILIEFPAYSSPFLVFEEVKMLLKVDLAAGIRRQVPQLLNKLSTSPIFTTDSPPIQLLKIVSKEFAEPIHYVLAEDDAITPYPALVCINGTTNVYVDFQRVLSANSPDDAVALVVAMYTIFDLAFDKKSRTSRFIYSILHAETRCLTNSIRIFIKEKNIDIYSEQQYQYQTIQNSSSHNSKTLSTESQQQSQSQIHSQGDSLLQHNSLAINQASEITAENENPDKNDNDTIIENTSSSPNRQSQTKNRKRQKRHVKEVDLNDEQSVDTDCLPLNDCTNSDVPSKSYKRKKRS